MDQICVSWILFFSEEGQNGRSPAGSVVPVVWPLIWEALRAEEHGCLEDAGGQIMELGRAKGSCPSRSPS